MIVCLAAILALNVREAVELWGLEQRRVEKKVEVEPGVYVASDSDEGDRMLKAAVWPGRQKQSDEIVIARQKWHRLAVDPSGQA
jgi:hypothetical protein